MGGDVEKSKIEEARRYVEDICRGIVSNPSQLVASATIDAYGLSVMVKANSYDMKVLIGRKGSVAGALRKIGEMWGRVHGAKLNVVIWDGPAAS